eukprot:19487-Eustigmatos_ZCMA.PRE.1
MADLVEASSTAIRCTQAHHIVTRTSVLDDESKLSQTRRPSQSYMKCAAPPSWIQGSSAMLEERVRATWVRDRGTELE